MNKTRMCVVAGILDIVSAAFKLLAVFGLIIAIVVFQNNPYIDVTRVVGVCPVNIDVILWIITVPLIIFGILAIIGGVYALQGKKWTLALVGSIAAALPFSFLGIAAFIITVLTRNEYE